jgi:hypothetical protein
MLIVLLALGAAALGVYAAGAGHAKPGKRLGVRGNVRPPLRPGVARPVNLVLTNPYGVRMRVTRVRVTLSVRPRAGTRGCSARRDFSVRQLARRVYPLVIPRRSRRSLSALRVKARYMPQIAMRDLPRVNQDACKGARLRMRYRLRARSAGGAR